MFRRKMYQKLQSWKTEFGGRYALLIEGPRRVGKTTIITEFVSKEYESYIMIDFSRPFKRVKSIFEDYGNDLDSMFVYLQQEFRVKLHPRRSAIVFDEVQNYPMARQMIKHLVADGRFDYYETGSLISIRQNIKDIVIPSEEMSIRMDPMDFEEYLWANGDEVTMPLVREFFEQRKPLGPAHQNVMRKFREYMLVGGMPQAVSAFLEGGSFDDAEIVKRNIIKLYEDDAEKAPGGLGPKVASILRGLPSLLTHHDKTFSPSEVKEGSATRDHMSAVSWLVQSRMVNICRCCSNPGPAMALDLLEYSFKLYMNDTGLLVSMALRYNVGDADKIYNDIIYGRLSINQGMFFENAAAQALCSSGHELVFSKFKADGSARLHEVDFLLSENRKLIPIEVKSGYSRAHKSLDAFTEKYSKGLGDIFVIHGKDLVVDGGVTYIPIYMAILLRSKGVCRDAWRVTGDFRFSLSFKTRICRNSLDFSVLMDSILR